jgi:hypothetical protein
MFTAWNDIPAEKLRCETASAPIDLMSPGHTGFSRT